MCKEEINENKSSFSPAKECPAIQHGNECCIRNPSPSISCSEIQWKNYLALPLLLLQLDSQDIYSCHLFSLSALTSLFLFFVFVLCIFA